MKKPYDFPFRQDFVLNIEVEIEGSKEKKIEKRLEYKQATIKETIEELDYIDKSTFQSWITKFLKEKGGFSDSEIILLFMNAETVEDLADKIITTRHRGVIDGKQEKGKALSVEPSIMPFSSVLVTLSERLNIDPISFQEKYTFEQMKYFIDGIEFLLNEQSKEGQKKNKEKYKSIYEDYDSNLISKLSKI